MAARGRQNLREDFRPTCLYNPANTANSTYSMPSPFQRIGLVGKFGDPGIAPTLNQLYRYLLRRGFQVAVESQSAELIDNADLTGVYIERLPEHCDLMIALGGDGTFLAAARAVADYEVPLLASIWAGSVFWPIFRRNSSRAAWNRFWPATTLPNNAIC